MKAWLLHRPTLVWLFLILATGLSWLLGTQNHHADLSPHAAATTSIVLIAFFKVRLVILHFMEVRSAPLTLRIVCEAWVVIVCGALLILYLTGPH